MNNIMDKAAALHNTRILIRNSNNSAPCFLSTAFSLFLIILLWAGGVSITQAHDYVPTGSFDTLIDAECGLDEFDCDPLSVQLLSLAEIPGIAAGYHSAPNYSDDTTYICFAGNFVGDTGMSELGNGEREQTITYEHFCRILPSTRDFFPHETIFTQSLDALDCDIGHVPSFSEFACLHVNSPPVVFDITADPSSPKSGEVVLFRVSAEDPDLDLLTYDWDFGDGATATESGLTTIHNYDVPGAYNVTVTATDGNGGADSFTITVSVVANQPPVISDFTHTPTVPGPGQPVSFTAVASDVDDSVLNYTWDFGDGGFGSGANASHTFATAGAYSVTLTVTDDGSNLDTLTKTVDVTVNNTPPESVTVTPEILVINKFDLAVFIVNATDPDNDPMSMTIDFGNGVSETVTGITAPHEFFTSYTASGSYTVTVSVSDGINPDVVASTSITVLENTAPFDISLKAEGFGTFFIGVPVVFTANATDNEGDNLDFVIDYGDGVSEEIIGAQPPQTFSHKYVAVGEYTVTLTITDINIDTPIETSTSVSVTNNQPPTIDNFTWLPLAPTEVDVVTFTALASDPDTPSTALVYTWEFGDGTFGGGDNGPNDPSSTKAEAYAPGKYFVTLFVSDGSGGTTTLIKEIEVSPLSFFVPPVDGADDNFSSEFGAGGVGVCTNDPYKAGFNDSFNNPSDPISHATGAVVEFEADYRGAGPLPLRFERHYSSAAQPGTTSLGGLWRHTFDRNVTVFENGSLASVTTERGTRIPFEFVGTLWAPTAATSSMLEQTADGWIHKTADNLIENYNLQGQLTHISNLAGHSLSLSYNALGQLQNVTDQFGRTLAMTYTPTGQLATLTDPALDVITYGYSGANIDDNLGSVTYADTRSRGYLYGDTRYPNALTGVVDENGVQLTTFVYDGFGRGQSSQHADGADLTTFIYLDGQTTLITDALGQQRTFNYALINGVYRNTEHNPTDPQCTTCGSSQKSTTFDAQGRPDLVEDFNGAIIDYDYDSRGLEIRRIEAKDKPEQRMYETQWHADYRLPVCEIAPLQTTILVYTATGQLEKRTLVDTTNTAQFPTVAAKACDALNALSVADFAALNTRSWSYTYYTTGVIAGLLQTVDGPRTDVADITTYQYDEVTGNLTQVTNALGHARKVQSDAHGRPLILETANGLISKLTYDQRGRLLRREEGTDALGYEVTEIQYDAAGNRIKVTLPNGAFLAYTYDGAQRLTSLSDQLGNRIDYTLDALGNRLKTDTVDPTGTLRRTQTQVYSQANQLEKIVGANEAETTTYTQYDGQGNVLSFDDPLSNTTQSAYDAHDRLTGVTDALRGETVSTYDADNRITRVTDPRGNSTTYTYDGLGNLLKVNSPDAGITRFTGHDGAGNPLAQMDASGLSTQFSYDALDRLDLVTYADGFTTSDYIYDEGVNGLGQLTRLVDNAALVDNASSVSFIYDVHGRLVEQTQVVGGIRLSTGYQYDASGQLDTLTYPSGKVIKYGYVNGLADKLTLGAVNGKPLVSAMGYEPLGPLSHWTWGNGTAVNRPYDLDGRITGYALGATANRTLTYTPVGNVSEIRDAANPANNLSYGYNALSQLTDFSGQGETQVIEYDANGNRNGFTLNGTLYSYALQGSSNRLTSISGPEAKTYTYDGAGRLKSDGVSNYNYDLKGRFGYMSIGNKEASYTVNALGQRVKKQISVDRQVSETVLYVYAEDGRLRGEYTGSGVVLREYVWVGEQPLVTLEADNTVRYVYTDHLNTPRAIMDEANAVIWQWESDPFGVTQPNGDVDGDGVNYTFNLRFPGQYYDVESGLHYNYFRTYDPATGRYITADPIGLAGGLNTYGYVGNNPLKWIDPKGLAMFPAEGAEPVVGRETIPGFGPGDPVPNFFENSVPAMHDTGLLHDSIVQFLTDAGFPDIIVNFNTMLPSYLIALHANIFGDGFSSSEPILQCR